MTITITITITISITDTMITSTVYLLVGKKERPILMETTLCVLSLGILVGNEGHGKEGRNCDVLGDIAVNPEP